MITMYAGEVIEDAAVDDALVRPLHPYTSGLLRSLPHLSPRHGKLPSIPGRVPSIMDMPNGCRFKARCPHAIDGCENEQELRDAGYGRKVRCWRFDELEPARRAAACGERADRGHGRPAMSAPAADIAETGRHRLGARSPGPVPDHRPPRHGEGGRRRRFRCPPRRDLWHHRRIRIGQDHDRPRAGVSAEAERRRHPARRPRSAGAAAPAIPEPPPRLPDHLPGPERRAEPAHDDPVFRAGAAGTRARREQGRAPEARARGDGPRRPAAGCRRRAIRTSFPAARSSAW